MNAKKINLNPVQFFGKLHREQKICFLKSSSRRGWRTLIAFNPADSFSYKTGQKNNFDLFLKHNTERGRKLIGYFSYDMGYELHNIKKKALDDLKLPDICFYAFDNYITFKNKTAEIHYTDLDFPELVAEINKRKLPKAVAGKNKNFKPAITEKQYAANYNKIKKHIFEGDIYQINLTYRLEAETSLPPRTIFTKVIKKNRVDFLAYIEGDGFEVLSASPERFVKIKNRQIETCPVKGTRPRGETQATDEKHKIDLMKSRKETAELNMITDLLRNDLGKVCKTGSVKVNGSRLISKCPTVWHTYSRITGKIHNKFAPVDALRSMLPGGSITGCPKKRAMEIIDELEPTTRSVYTGIIGYIDPDFDMDFNVAIRTIIKKGNRLYLQVGGGIVYDSTEKAELKETVNKAKSFMEILL